jgi:hypothetical protein
MPGMRGRVLNFAGKFAFGFAVAALLQYFVWMRKLKVLNDTIFRIAESLAIRPDQNGVIPPNPRHGDERFDLDGSEKIAATGASESRSERLNVKRDFRKVLRSKQPQTTDMNIGHDHCLATRAPTLDL